MSLNNRIINNAIKNFVQTPVAAPSYCDLTEGNDLLQCDESETRNIFGETHVHYRWVDYAGTLELMSFTEGECVWRFGSIDPSKEPTDILVLDDVVIDDPSTYNNSFYISDENNICKHHDSDLPLCYSNRPSLLNTIDETVDVNEEPVNSSILAPAEEVEEEKPKDHSLLLNESVDVIEIETPTESPSTTQELFSRPKPPHMERKPLVASAPKEAVLTSESHEQSHVEKPKEESAPRAMSSVSSDLLQPRSPVRSSVLERNQLHSTGTSVRPGVSRPAGVAGVTRPAGVAGVTRPAGVAGVTRPAGVTGVTRPAGVTGVTRPAGVTGVTRPAGVAGVTRPAGATGVTRPAGVAGVTGVTRPAGVTGVTRPAGVTGVTRPVGATGVTRSARTTGVTRPAGMTGTTGVTRPVGATGVTRPAGATGVTRPEGTTGVARPAGMTGTTTRSVGTSGVRSGISGTTTSTRLPTRPGATSTTGTTSTTGVTGTRTIPVGTRVAHASTTATTATHTSTAGTRPMAGSTSVRAGGVVRPIARPGATGVTGATGATGNRPAISSSGTRTAASSSLPSYMRQTKASMAQGQKTEPTSVRANRPPIGRVVSSLYNRRVTAVKNEGEKPSTVGSHNTVVAPLTGNRTQSSMYCVCYEFQTNGKTS